VKDEGGKVRGKQGEERLKRRTKKKMIKRKRMLRPEMVIILQRTDYKIMLRSIGLF
jgi:hypothetical protein